MCPRASLSGVSGPYYRNRLFRPGPLGTGSSSAWRITSSQQ